MGYGTRASVPALLSDNGNSEHASRHASSVQISSGIARSFVSTPPIEQGAIPYYIHDDDFID